MVSHVASKSNPKQMDPLDRCFLNLNLSCRLRCSQLRVGPRLHCQLMLTIQVMLMLPFLRTTVCSIARPWSACSQCPAG